MDGQFVTMSVVRGIEELKPLWKVINHSTAFIAGGYARYCVTKEANPAIANDVDVFCKTVEAYEEHKNKFKELGFVVEHENKWSITYAKQLTAEWSKLPKIQLIKPVTTPDGTLYGSVVDVLSAFDFSISRVAFLTETVALVDKTFEADDKAKRITICSVTNPVKIVRRLVKYSKKGYFVQNWEIAKIFKKWDELKPEIKTKYLVESDYYLTPPTPAHQVGEQKPEENKSYDDMPF